MVGVSVNWATITVPVKPGGHAKAESNGLDTVDTGIAHQRGVRGSG